jgi:hypothetical protein
MPITEHDRKLLDNSFTEYNRYSLDQIQAATSSLSSDIVIGNGTYGIVYEANFRHMNSLEGCGSRQLQKELLYFTCENTNSLFHMLRKPSGYVYRTTLRNFMTLPI